MTDKHKLAAELTKKLADEGKLIEAGFAAMQIIALQNAPEAQISDMRIAYMAGAEHLFRSIIVIMDADAEPTAQDMRRMDLIDAELEQWRAVLEGYVGKTGGRA